MVSTVSDKQFEIATLLDTEKGIKRDVFLHEYIYVLSTKKPIPEKCLVIHINGNTLDNSSENLGLYTVENDEYTEEKNKVFHEHNLEKYKSFLEEHFQDVVRVLGI